MESFNIGAKIMFGSNDFSKLFEGINKVFVVTDKFMFESGKIAYVTEKLEELGIEYEVFSDVSADPDIDIVTKGVGRMLRFAPNAVIAFGGGSSIDAAKSIVYFVKREGNMEQCLFVAIPTTSGTGSEVSRFSIITDKEKGIKYPLVDDSLLPNAAILDAELVKSVPPAVTADTGIDVLTHAIEAFVSTQANDFTDAAAEKAMKLVRRYLLRVYENPDDMEARQGMHNASCLAGIAFSNSGLGLNHGMAHALGGKFHIPHGKANGILLPYVMAYNAGCHDTLTATAKRYAQIARILHLESSSIRQSAFNMVRTTKQYINKLNIPNTIEAFGVRQEEFEKELESMAEAAWKDSCTATNPRKCSKEDIITVYKRAYFGKVL